MSGERGSPAVRALLERAERLATAHGAAEVSSAHLLLAMAAERAGHLGTVLEAHAVTREAVEQGIDEDTAERGGRTNGTRPARGPLAPAPEIAAAVANAVRVAARAGRQTFDPEDLLLAVLADRAARATRLLGRLGKDADRIATDIRKVRGQEEAIARAEALEGGGCPFHVGPGSCAVPGAAAPPAVPGVWGEVRDLGARFDALVENHRALAERTEAIVRYLRVLWVGSLLLVAGLGVCLWLLLRQGG